MRYFLVWDRAYGREDATVYRCWTRKGACRRFRRESGCLGALSWESIP